jgi:ppGpp synthetase/RelA/SpoT-type nucleotidyltranferase
MALSRKTLELHYTREQRRYRRASTNLLTTIEALLEDLGPARGIHQEARVENHVKEFGSFYAKARKWEREGRVHSVGDCFEKIYDIARARVVCQTVDDAERIVRLLEEQDRLYYKRKVEEHPGASKSWTGYRAVHIDLEIDTPVGGNMVATPCEVQVMTALQYAWGLYTRTNYKERNAPPLVATLMRELSDLLNVADRFAGHLIREAEKASATTRS